MATKKNAKTKPVKKAGKKTQPKGNFFQRILNVLAGRPKTTVLVGVIIIALGVGLLPRIQQTFASGCSGTHIDTYSIRRPSDGAYAGYLKLYWNGYRNCAIAYGGGVTSGDRIWREVCIRADGQSRDCDRGYFYSYAGPVFTGGSSGKCLDLFAYFAESDGSRARGWLQKNDVHCG